MTLKFGSDVLKALKYAVERETKKKIKTSLRKSY